MSLESFPSFLLNSSEVDLDKKDHRIYAFRTFRLDVSERRLTENGSNIPLTPKAFDVLAYLVDRSGRLVEKDELLEKVWPDSIVEESNLARIVHTLRKLLGEDKNGNKFIETVSKKGYRFVAEVSILDDTDHIHEAARPEVAPVGETTPKTSSFRSKAAVFSAAIATLILVLALVAWSFRARNEVGAEPSEIGLETTSGEAYHHYSQGRMLVERRYPGDTEKAIEQFERAIALDPNYANALAGKADAKLFQFWTSSSHKDISEARTAVRRSIEIDPVNAYARAIHCRILTTYDWDHKAAEQECAKAIELDPENYQAQREVAFLMSSLGRESQALEAANKSVVIAPTSFNKRSRGVILYFFRRYDEAIAQLEQVQETDSNYQDAVRWLVKCYEMKGEYAEAVETHLRFLQLTGASPDEAARVRSIFQTEAWPGVLRSMIGRKGLGPTFQAGIYAQLGETELSFATLEEMYQRKSVHLMTVPREPAFDPIRNDPRYEDLLRRIGLPR